MQLLTADRARSVALRSRSKRSGAKIAPKFKRGDRVVVMNRHPEGHTRAPRFIRGKSGVIHLDHGVFPLPDTHAHGLGERPQHVYSVRFEARDVWGPEAAAHDGVYLDLWDDYLERG